MSNGKKKQILIIHGGDAFETYDKYLEYLKKKDVSIEKLKAKDWKRNLSEELGEKYEVLLPQMPNSQNARYLEWRIWFERLIPLLDETIVLIGHSLGGIFVAKYLSENSFPKKVKATFLVAAPYNTTNQHPLVDFIITDNLEKLDKQGGKIFIYHSKDDKVVPFSNCENYQSLLPSAKTRIFDNREHFNQELFPEIVEDIKALGKW